MKKSINIQNKLTNRDQLSVAKYLNELQQDPETKPLSPQEEASLFTEYKLTGSKRIKDRLIKANLRFVITLAKQYESDKAKIEDLIQVGNIGLIKAMDKFDVTVGTRILTFAGWDIRQEIQAYVNEELADIVQPANRTRIKSAIKKVTQMLIVEGNENPAIEQIVEKYTQVKDKHLPELTPVLLAQINANHKPFVSASLGFAGKNPQEPDFVLEDTFVASADYNTDAEIMANDIKSEVKMILQSLSDREREIVEYTFGLNDKEEKTPEQIADIMGYTRERIGQLLHGALNVLRTRKNKVANKIINHDVVISSPIVQTAFHSI